MINLAPMQIRIVIIAVMAAICFAAGWKISSWRSQAAYTATLKAALEEQRQQLEAANVASIALERKRSEQAAKEKVITKRVEVYLAGKPAKECFDEEALALYNGEVK